MRILHVISTVDPSHGGPSEALLQRGRVLREAGHDVEVLCADTPGAAFLRDSPIPIHAVGPAKGGMGYSPPLKTWLSAHAKEYDAVIASGIWQYCALATWQVMRRLDRPYWVFTHGMLDPYFNRRYPLKALKKRAYWPLLYPVLRDAAAVFFTCEEEKLLARTAFRPYKVKEHVVKYGTRGPDGDERVSREAFRAAFPKLADQTYLLFLSRIDPKKGVDLLVQAFHAETADDPNLHLVLAGPVEDEYRREVQSLIDNGPAAGRIHWTGMVNGDLKWGAFRTAEAFILPSHQENFGIALVEAMACGLPVMTTRRVNIWREIEADGAGFVDEDTLEGTKNLIRRWLSTTTEDRRDRSARARSSFQNRYTVEQSAESLLEAIKATYPKPP